MSFENGYPENGYPWSESQEIIISIIEDSLVDFKISRYYFNPWLSVSRRDQQLKTAISLGNLPEITIIAGGMTCHRRKLTVNVADCDWIQQLIKKLTAKL